MATCPACGADIQHAKTRSGENVPLEKFTEPTGSQRWRIVELGPPLVIERVADGAPTDAYPDHRKDCPDYGRGLVN